MNARKTILTNTLKNNVMTTKELAEVLGVSTETVRTTAKKIIDPSKLIWRVINGGKSQAFDEAQATAIKIELQNHSKIAKNGIETRLNEKQIAAIKQRMLPTAEVVGNVNDYEMELMTTKELAEQLNTRYTKEEVTVLLEFMKSNNNRTALDLSDRLIGLTTDLTPALKIKKAMELMQEGYKEELAILKTENNKQKALLIEQQPKVDFYDDVTGSKDTIDMKEVAKILNIKNVGRNKLFEILRNKNILDHRNQPYQKYVDAGYFRVIESRFNLPDGEIKISLKTVVFQRGLILSEER